MAKREAEIKITVINDEFQFSITSEGINNYELVGLLDYAKHSINQKHFENNVKKNEKWLKQK
jgi:hypothetical protein